MGRWMVVFVVCCVGGWDCWGVGLGGVGGVWLGAVVWVCVGVGGGVWVCVCVCACVRLCAIVCDCVRLCAIV